MDELRTQEKQSRKVEELHGQIQRWKSEVDFCDDEILFIKRLLNSYVFEPTTPNLYERIENYKGELHRVIAGRTELLSRIGKHENQLAGMLECTDIYCDMRYYQKHVNLQSEVARFIANFRNLKSDIFNYAGGILKNRKPV